MKKINAKTQGKFVSTVNIVNIWFSRLSLKTLVLYIMQCILYQIQAYIGRLVLLLTKKFGQIIYFVENIFSKKVFSHF